MNRTAYSLLICLLLSSIVASSGLAKATKPSSRQAAHQEKEGIIERLNQTNGRLQDVLIQSASARETLSSHTEQLEQVEVQEDAEIDALAKEIWLILDQGLTTYLTQAMYESVEELNKGIGEFFETATTPSKFGWSAEIQLSATPTPNMYLATYENFFDANNLVSTFRVIRKVKGQWQVVGRMEEKPVITQMEPLHRSELKKSIERKEKQVSPLSDPSGYVAIQIARARATAFHPILQNNISISSRSIQILNSGGVQFVSLHIPRATRGSEPTAIEWLWMPTGELEARAWVWGDQWKYNEKTEKNIGRWQSANPNKTGKKVIQEDL